MYRPPGATLAVALWELDPGEKVEYHFHHGNEETIIVLRGRPTLRTPEGERELDEGEVVHFPRGAEGAHGVSNCSEKPVRYLMAAAHGSPEVIGYPDKGTLVVMARTESQRGGQLISEHRLDDAVEQDWSKR
jgi:uncharacterized cupin superfamily protein